MTATTTITEQTTIDLDYRYPVMEAFYTLQGEGSYAGRAAYFIRLAGCDVGCVWCDVKESWQEEGHPVKSIAEIIADAKAEINARQAVTTLPIIVITGGEPLLHNLYPLTAALHTEGFFINIETSGSSPMSGNIDWICLSPKKFKAPLEENLAIAHELKIIIFNKSDFKWAEEHAAKVNTDCKLYLQTEWEKRATMTPLIVDYIKNNPQWQLSLQTHKYIGVP